MEVLLYITYKVWGSVCSEREINNNRELRFIFIWRLNQIPGLRLNSEFKSFEMSFLFQRVSRLPSFPSKNCACLRGRVNSKRLHSSDSNNSAGREYNERLVPPIYVKTPPAWVRYAWPIVIANALIMFVQLPDDTKDNWADRFLQGLGDWNNLEPLVDARQGPGRNWREKSSSCHCRWIIRSQAARRDQGNISLGATAYMATSRLLWNIRCWLGAVQYIPAQI